jgi:hypothetical protein
MVDLPIKKRYLFCSTIKEEKMRENSEPMTTLLRLINVTPLN